MCALASLGIVSAWAAARWPVWLAFLGVCATRPASRPRTQAPRLCPQYQMAKAVASRPQQQPAFFFSAFSLMLTALLAAAASCSLCAFLW